MNEIEKKEFTPEEQAQMEAEIQKFCQEQEITRSEFEGWIIGNIMIGWMRDEKKKMMKSGQWAKGWSKYMKLPFTTLEKVKARRGKKKLVLPNIFKLCDEIRKREEYDKECIDYICPNCKSTIWRHNSSRKNCPLCGAPYNYDIEKIKKQLI